MASFRKYKTSKGEIRYRAEIRRKGAKPYSKSFHKMADAKEWAKLQDENMVRFASGLIEERQYTFAEAADRYAQEHLPTIRNETAKHSIAWWKEQLGPRFLHTIRPAEIISLRNKLSNEPKLQKRKGFNRPVPAFDAQGKPMLRKPKTVQAYVDVLLNLYNIAIHEWEWVTVNPIQNVKKLKVHNERNRYLSDHIHLWPGENEARHWDNLTNTEKQEAKAKFPRAYELPRLLDALLSQEQNNHKGFKNPMWAYYLCIIQLGTGLRLSEATHLVWEENNIIEHPIVIVDMERAVLILKSTKCDNSPRLKPLSQETYSVLQKLYAERSFHSPLVFPGKEGRKAFDFRSRITQAIKVAGLQDFRWHDLRHTTASYLSMMGAGQKEIMEALHHKSMKASQRYQHLSNEHLRGLLNRLTTTVLEKKKSPSRF